MAELDEKVSEAIEQTQGSEGSGLNSVIAALVAVLATFMALCNIKDGNIVQAMAQEQSAAIDTWAYYQAKSTKQHLAEGMVDRLTIDREVAGEGNPRVQTLLAQKVAFYEEKVKKYEREKEEIKKQAEEHQQTYDRLNQKDDQFDMAEAGISIAIALLGISALTKKRWLVVVAILFAGFGVVMGLAGFLGWHIHPDSIAKFLS